MIIFNSDLDNTLIYSYKRDIGMNKKCVEVYQEREISFMTNQSFRLLQMLNEKVMIVPTTTRTMEQYKRISLGIGIPKYALVCNGGILLENGVISKKWYQESLKIILNSKDELMKAKYVLDDDTNRIFEIRFINDLFLFTKSEQPQMTVDYLKNILNTDVVDVLHNGIKVYVVPKKLTKGNAINRLRHMLEPDKIIAAGDSDFDISMLQTADIAFFPKALHVKFHCKVKGIAVDDSEKIFSDIVLNSIDQYIGSK